MAISLQKGGNVNLNKEAPGLKKLLVGLICKFNFLFTFKTKFFLFFYNGLTALKETCMCRKSFCCLGISQ